MDEEEINYNHTNTEKNKATKEQTYKISLGETISLTYDGSTSVIKKTSDPSDFGELENLTEKQS